MRKIGFFILGIWISLSLQAQHTITVEAHLNAVNHTLDITQEIHYVNTSDVILNELFLNDWANSFSSKNTPLAKRFSENFKSGFHFEKEELRGRTSLHSIVNDSQSPISWERTSELDIVKLSLTKPLFPGENRILKLSYTVKIAEDKFTRFGVDKEGNYKLKYWLITPAVFNGTWQAYSNKNTDDYYQTPTHYDILINVPSNFHLFSDLEVTSEKKEENRSIVQLQGHKRLHTDIYLQQNPNFESIITDKLEFVTNLKDKKVSPTSKAILVDRITHFLDAKLGSYPFEKLLLSEADYRNSPVYGLNQLPDFISPFPNGFELDLEILKTATRKYLVNSLTLNPRKDHWLIGAIQVHTLIDYVNTYYPDMKIVGSFSDFWIIEWLHAAELEFNDQYSFLYLNMARTNLHQGLTTPKDSLVKFNKNIASDY
nr:metalloprotease [Bacteroidota bacterium]